MTLARSNFRQSVIMPSKGLLNNPGENNCFMNSAVQVLWHLDVFRRSLRLLTGHTCLKECCIFCALKEIFEKFQESDETALTPDVLRIALAKAFQDQRKFEIGRMGDAAECFENILRRLHYHIAYGVHEDTCNAKHCIPHQKFAMQVLEQTLCKCGASSKPLNFSQIVNYVSASALIDEARKPRKNGHRPLHSFGELLKATSSLDESRPCPDEENCLFKDRSIIPTKMHRMILNCPDIVVIGINWDTDRPTTEYVMDLLACLGKRLYIKDLFDDVVDDRARKMQLRLVGVMTYYGKHYTTFFYNTRQEIWYYLDDARVKEIGKEWDTVKEKCIRGRHQPLLVFYANQDGEPIKVTKAPKETNFVSKEELLTAQKSNESTRGKNAGKIKSPKKLKKEFEDKGKEPRKSFRNMIDNALRRRKSSKHSSSSSPSKRQLRYSGDHVLNVSGHENESLNQSMDDKLIRENRHADESTEKTKTKRKSVETIRDRSLSAPANPEEEGQEKSPESPKKMNGETPQRHLLQKHRQHVNSIESMLDVSDELCDNESVRNSKGGRQKMRKSLDVGEGREKANRNGENGEERRCSVGSSFDAGIQKLHQQPRRFIDQGDAFADAVDEAESLVISSIAAEQEGNIMESYQLCNEANVRYRSAMNLKGITEKMMQHADKKCVETQNRSQLLTSKISAFREAKSGDYDRTVSKTSDYGSLSDASWSPMTPAEFSAFSQKQSKETQEQDQVQRLTEKGGIQAKLNKERNRQEVSSKADAPRSLFFTLPRKKKKNHQHKLSSPQPPTQSEMEQLTALLRNFENNGHRDGRGNLDAETKISRQHKSIPDLYELGQLKSQLESGGVVMKSIDASKAHADTTKLNAGRDGSNGDVSYGRQMRSNSSIAKDRLTAPITSSDLCKDTSTTNHLKQFPQGRSDGLVTNSSGGIESYQTARAIFEVKAPNYDCRKSDDYLVERRTMNGRLGNINSESEKVNSEADQKKIFATRTKSPQEMSGENVVRCLADQKIESNSRNIGSGSSKIGAVVLDSAKRDVVNGSNYKENAIDDSKKTKLKPKPIQSQSPKHNVKSRSIFQVVVPKIMNTDRIWPGKKSKKSVESREREYAAMLDAEAFAMKNVHQKEALKARPDPLIRENNSGDKRNLVTKVSSNVNHSGEESFVVEPDVAQNQIAKATTQVLQRRLFNDDNSPGMPQKDTSQVRANLRYNDRYGGSKGREATAAEEDIVTQVRAKYLDKEVGRNEMVKSPQRAGVKVASATNAPERHSIESKENERASEHVNACKSDEISARKYKDSTSPLNVSADAGLSEERPASRISNRVEIYAETEKDVSARQRYLQNGQIEPPPRRNPYVYRSSELYKAKNDSPKNSATRSLPEGSQKETETRQEMSSQYQGHQTLSRWTNGVDFSKSTRQLCQQCGTVTVEKPKKFCRKCQSDYL